VRSIDPRDVRWEITSPTFRVYFWEPQPAPLDVADHPVGYRSTEYEIRGADVPEVLAWADAIAPRRSTYVVYAVVDHSRERGLVRLAGNDPTTPQERSKQ
jgi:hypothetical protein